MIDKGGNDAAGLTLAGPDDGGGITARQLAAIKQRFEDVVGLGRQLFRGWPLAVARIRGRKPGNMGLDAPFPGPVLDALACPLTVWSPGPQAGGTGLRPPTQNRHLEVPGHTVPRWTRVSTCALLIGAPSLFPVLAGRTIRSEGFRRSAAPTATPRS